MLDSMKITEVIKAVCTDIGLNLSYIKMTCVNHIYMTTVKNNNCKSNFFYCKLFFLMKITVK